MASFMLSAPFAVNEHLVVNASVTRSERQILLGETLKVKCIVSAWLGTELKKKILNVFSNIIHTIPHQSDAIGCWVRLLKQSNSLIATEFKSFNF